MYRSGIEIQYFSFSESIDWSFLSFAVLYIDYSSGNDEKSIFFRIYRMIISMHGDLCVPPNRRADSLREINEAERFGRMQGALDQKSLEISNEPFPLSLALWLSARRFEGIYRSGTEDQNLSESIY